MDGGGQAVAQSAVRFQHHARTHITCTNSNTPTSHPIVLCTPGSGAQRASPPPPHPLSLRPSAVRCSTHLRKPRPASPPARLGHRHQILGVRPKAPVQEPQLFVCVFVLAGAVGVGQYQGNSKAACSMASAMHHPAHAHAHALPTGPRLPNPSQHCPPAHMLGFAVIPRLEKGLCEAIWPAAEEYRYGSQDR